jgi:hypothetical protein
LLEQLRTWRKLQLCFVDLIEEGIDGAFGGSVVGFLLLCKPLDGLFELFDFCGVGGPRRHFAKRLWFERETQTRAQRTFKQKGKKNGLGRGREREGQKTKETKNNRLKMLFAFLLWFHLPRMNFTVMNPRNTDKEYLFFFIGLV